MKEDKNRAITLETIPSGREIHYITPTIQPVTIKLRVAAYARVSSNSEDQLHSFAAQMRYYTGLISANENWELVDVYADEAVTGTSTEKRDEFNRMVADCRCGKIDRIITKSLSRFARNSLDVLRIVRELKRIGVSVLFEKENLDTATLTSEVLLTLYSTFAQEESQTISQNKKKGNRMHMRNGTYVSTNVPYGYRLVDKLPQLYEPEATIVRRIFEEYLMGYSTYKIAQGLTRDHIPRKDGKTEWRHQAVHVILRNERYIGDMLLQKSYQTDTLPYQSKINRGKLEKFYIKGTHEAIIDPIQFRLANILLKLRTPAHNGLATGEYLLTRKIRCGECSTAYRRKVARGKVYWVCRQHNDGKERCSSTQILESDIEAAFLRLYHKLKANYTQILTPMLRQLEKLREMRMRSHPEVSSINKQIAELSEQNHVMNGLMRRGILDSALFITQSDDLNRRIRDLKLSKAKLVSADKSDKILQETEDLIAILEDAPAQITEPTEALFSELVRSITVQQSAILAFALSNGLVLHEKLERSQ